MCAFTTARSARESSAGETAASVAKKSQHGCHVGLNHARAFRASQNANFFAADANIWLHAHFGRLSVVMIARVNS